MRTSRAGEPARPPARGAPPRQAPRRAGARGFTLVELLVVMTLVALIATLATPMLRNALPARELRGAAQALQAEFRLARSAAIRDNRESWVLVDVEAGSYRRDGGATVELPEGIALDLLTATREQIDDRRGRIRFFPDGTATGGRVRLRRGEAAWEVAVDWFDGRIALDAPAE